MMDTLSRKAVLGQSFWTCLTDQRRSFQFPNTGFSTTPRPTWAQTCQLCQPYRHLVSCALTDQCTCKGKRWFKPNFKIIVIIYVKMLKYWTPKTKQFYMEAKNINTMVFQLCNFTVEDQRWSLRNHIIKWYRLFTQFSSQFWTKPHNLSIWQTITGF